MSRRNKLLKFAQISEFPNVYENFSVTNPQLLVTADEPVDLRGAWAGSHFGNDHPVVLELACGRGEYTLALARRFPNVNFIGVDIKGARIWKGAGIALEEKLANAAFVRTRIECLEAFFAPGEIAEIWITFPDPFPRERQVNRRLTAQFFRNIFHDLLPSGGALHLKTDNTGFFLFTLEEMLGDQRFSVKSIFDDVDRHLEANPVLEEQTFYEKVHRIKGSKIKYARFTVRSKNPLTR